MKKSKHLVPDNENLERIVAVALEEKNPFEAIKNEFGLAEKEVTEIMKKRLSANEFELWKKKTTAKKPKPKPLSVDDFDDELEGKYYIKNKLD